MGEIVLPHRVHEVYLWVSFLVHRHAVQLLGTAAVTHGTRFLTRTVTYSLGFGTVATIWPRLFTSKRLAVVEDAMMFPDKSGKNLDTLISYIDTAEYTLDVCVFTLTNKELESALLRAHRRGVL